MNAQAGRIANDVNRPNDLTGDAFVSYVLNHLARLNLPEDAWHREMVEWFQLFTVEELSDDLPSWKRLRAEKLAIVGSPSIVRELQ